MLQKPEKVGYNRLSRRQILRAFGVGMGAMAVGTLTGCTSGLLRKLDSPYKMTVLSKEDRLAQAFAKLNKKLLREAADEMKAILKAYKREGTTRTAISKTRKIAERVFAHYNSVGLTLALEENAHAALQAYPGLDLEVISYLRSADVTEYEIQKFRDLCQRARDELMSKAPNLQLAKMMTNLIAKLRRMEIAPAQALSTTMIPLFWGCVGAILVAIGSTVLTAIACSTCASEPSKISCWGCAGAAIITIGAAITAYDQCT